jgi:hypothetical protein
MSNDMTEIKPAHILLESSDILLESSDILLESSDILLDRRENVLWLIHLQNQQEQVLSC